MRQKEIEIKNKIDEEKHRTTSISHLEINVYRRTIQNEKILKCVRQSWKNCKRLR